MNERCTGPLLWLKALWINTDSIQRESDVVCGSSETTSALISSAADRRTCDSNHFCLFLQKIGKETVFPSHTHAQTLSHVFTCYELECTVVSRISTECILDFVGCQVKQIQVILHWKVFLEAIFETDITCTTSYTSAWTSHREEKNKSLYGAVARLFYSWPSDDLPKRFLVHQCGSFIVLTLISGCSSSRWNRSVVPHFGWPMM